MHWVIDFLLRDNSKSLIVLAVGAVLGALMKFFFDQWSAKNQARREMVQSVTQSVEELAKEYYWHLANHASTLAVIFNDYLERRQDIQLLQSPPRELRRQLSTLIEQKVGDSFFYYARFTKLTFRFDWCAGSTFLLRHFWAGQTIRNLQNALKGVLDLDLALIDYIDAPDKDGKPKETTPSDLLRKEEFAPMREKYKKFFKDEEKVRRAAQYLEACGDLFNYELAELYHDWFKNWRGKVDLEPDLDSRSLRRNLQDGTIRTVGEVVARSRRRGYSIAPLSSPSYLPPTAPAQREAAVAATGVVPKAPQVGKEPEDEHKSTAPGQSVAASGAAPGAGQTEERSDKSTSPALPLLAPTSKKL